MGSKSWELAEGGKEESTTSLSNFPSSTQVGTPICTGRGGGQGIKIRGVSPSQIRGFL